MISLILGSIFFYSVYDLFFTYDKNDIDRINNYQKIKKIYKNINDINTVKYTDISKPKIIFYSVVDTFKTIVKFKYIKIVSNMYSPKRLTKNLVYVPVFINNNWYYSIFHKHISKIPVVKKVKHNDNDVTDIVKKFLGPNEDFSGHEITPEDLGYDNLQFEIIILGKKEVLNYYLKEKIVLKK